MTEFLDEALKLGRILNNCDVDIILQYLNKYSDKCASERLVLVLEDYFSHAELTVPLEDLRKEVFVIEDLFPEYNRDYILNLLEAIGNETNRLKVVTKFLVNDRCNGSRKRGFSGDEPKDVPCKKFKTDGINKERATQSSSIESDSTVIYTFDDIAPQPSTSGITEDRLQENLIDDSTSVKTIPMISVSEFTSPNVENIEGVQTVSTVECKEKEKGYNLYNHLQEIFTNASYKLIRTVCKTCNASKHTPPSDNVMNSIVTKLLLQPTDSELVKLPDVISTEWEDLMQSDPDLKLWESLEVITNDDSIALDDDMDLVNDEIDLTEEVEENTLVYPLMEIFPEACPQFIRKKCRGKKNDSGMLDELISDILETDYPKRLKRNSPARVLDASEQLQMMKSILVDADPDYLQMHCDRLIDKPDTLKEFIENAIETRNYPTLKDFLRKQQISAQQKQYTDEFSVEKFLEVIPNPFEYFGDPGRNTIHMDYQSYHYALCYLRNKFDKLPLRSIRESFAKSNRNFLKTCHELVKVPSSFRMKSKRAKCAMPNLITNIPLLQEIAFFEHQTEILAYSTEKELQEEVARAQTKAAGLMNTCSCCFDDEVMPKDVLLCELGCFFCKSCVRKGVEVAFGDGKLNFPCLGDCSSHFSLQVLQAALTPKLFSTIALKKQVEEVKAAGIEDLETCPFCDFVTIPARDDKLFRCLNPECMKESCRQCREPSHVPLRCDEVEKDHDVKTRTFIENKMTEALLRTCYKCGLKFIKEDGCNKMTCSCGALMCYVCGEPVKSYQHFNGLGGDKTQLCPLYSDTKKLHRDAVIKGAEDAKHEIGVNDSELKIDPALDIQEHYKISPSTATIPNIPLNPFNQLPQNEVLLQRRALQLFERQVLHRGRRNVHRGRHRDRSH